jgi:hypothetical protein
MPTQRWEAAGALKAHRGALLFSASLDGPDERVRPLSLLTRSDAFCSARSLDAKPVWRLTRGPANLTSPERALRFRQQM